MTISIDLPPEVEAKIRKKALDKKMKVEDYIALLIIEDLDLPTEYCNKIVVTIID